MLVLTLVNFEGSSPSYSAVPSLGSALLKSQQDLGEASLALSFCFD